MFVAALKSRLWKSAQRALWQRRNPRTEKWDDRNVSSGVMEEASGTVHLVDLGARSTEAAARRAYLGGVLFGRADHHEMFGELLTQTHPDAWRAYAVARHAGSAGDRRPRPVREDGVLLANEALDAADKVGEAPLPADVSRPRSSSVQSSRASE